MRPVAGARQWRTRVVLGAVLGVVGYGLAELGRMGPEPLPYVVMVLVVLSLAWLVSDVVDVSPAEWTPALRAPGDRVHEASPDLRILAGHLQAGEPSEALRDRLVALARTRDPVLAEALRDELTPVRRLAPAEIDRILTRIEEARDRR